MISFALMHISLLTVAIAAVIDNLICMLWYSEFLFAERWQKLSGIKLDGKAIGFKKKIYSFGISFFYAYGLAWALEAMNALGRKDAILSALLLVFFFYVSQAFSAKLWERRSLTLSFIEIGQLAAAFAAMAALFAYSAAY